jgi:hypothetical protein
MKAVYSQPKYQRFMFQNILFAFILIGTYVASYLIVLFPFLIAPLMFNAFIVISAIPPSIFSRNGRDGNPAS